jgi:hypothetical protein
MIKQNISIQMSTGNLYSGGVITLSTLKLNSKRNRYHSQWGEDGVLEYVLGRLPRSDRQLVEFGAWDGQFLSNSFYLIQKLNYSALLIEMDTERFQELERNMLPYQSICLNLMVGYQGDSKLDSILAKSGIPIDFDLLSIDIDGNDYQVWEAMVIYKPKVVIIEINSSILPGKVNINNPDHTFELFVSGSSITALSHLAQAKGYKLIANVGCNAIFVREEFYRIFHKIQLSEYDFFTYEAFSKRSLSLNQKIQAIVFAIARPRLIYRLIQLLKGFVLR